MTYGLVYRPSSLLAASSNAHQSTIQSSTAEADRRQPSYVPNETKIAEQRYRGDAETSRTSVANVSGDDDGSATPSPPSTPSSAARTQNSTGSGSSSASGTFKYAKKDIPAWMVQNGVVSHQYQVYENDSDAEESAHRFKTDGGFHKKDAEYGKKKSKGSSGKKFSEKKNAKEGENDYKESRGKKKGTKRGGHKSFAKKEGGFEKHEGKKKKNEYGSSDKHKNYSSSKGYKNKFKLDKEDNVHEFWHDHQEEGEFIKYGEKKKSGYDGKKGRKKHKWKKKGKKGRKKKKKGKKTQKEGDKEEKGYNEKKGTKHFYHNEKEYGSQKKSAYEDDQKKS